MKMKHDERKNEWVIMPRKERIVEMVVVAVCAVNEWVIMPRKERIVEMVVEAVCAVFALVAFFLSLWIYCVATPDQCSAECDWLSSQIETAER